MPSVSLAPTFGVGYQAFTRGGLVLSGGLIYTYEAGGTTPAATYTTIAGNVQNANPIVLAADGRPPQAIWLVEGNAYRFDLTDADGNLIKTYDNMEGINDPTAIYAAFAAANGSSLVGFIQAGSGAVATTVQANDRLTFNLQQFGGTGDGTTNNTSAFNSAITAINALGGGNLLVTGDDEGSTFLVSSTVTLKPNVFIVLAGATINFAGGATSCFQFVGTAEAQSLNAGICGVGTITSTTALTGYGVRLRNFANFAISEAVVFFNFSRGVKADWGYGLFIRGKAVTFTTNTRGVEVGGDDNLPAGIAAGIRGGPGDPFMDTVTIDGAAFSQNQLDINDMGSTLSLGILSVTNCSFYEGSAVSGKSTYVHVCNRKGVKYESNWTESPNNARVALLLSNVTADSATLLPPCGVSVNGNDMLMNGSSSVGVYVIRAVGADIRGNNFEFSATNTPILLQDNVTPADVGINSYQTYPDINGHVNPVSITGPVAGHKTEPGAIQLTDAATVATNAAAGDYFLLTAGASRTIGAPTNPSDGKCITYDIYNNSGGAMTTTWNAVFAVVWTDPANTKRKTVTFRYTAASTLWIQVGTISPDL